jgi:hypothetical protein
MLNIISEKIETTSLEFNWSSYWNKREKPADLSGVNFDIGRCTKAKLNNKLNVVV